MGRVKKVFAGPGGHIRVVKLKAEKRGIPWTMQRLYPLELSSPDWLEQTKSSENETLKASDVSTIKTVVKTKFTNTLENVYYLFNHSHIMYLPLIRGHSNKIYINHFLCPSIIFGA